jgi:hypothetical protein
MEGLDWHYALSPDMYPQGCKIILDHEDDDVITIDLGVGTHQGRYVPYACRGLSSQYGLD